MRVSPSGRWHVTFNHERFILLGGSNPLTRTVWEYGGMEDAGDLESPAASMRVRVSLFLLIGVYSNLYW